MVVIMLVIAVSDRLRCVLTIFSTVMLQRSRRCHVKIMENLIRDYIRGDINTANMLLIALVINNVSPATYLTNREK